ncbi:hypothetical protein BGZ79_003365 [Entomortierella chlamydospora]|nr:hypothetical protein BGZ79_003365 [Entomortierella chlamydospora]
MSKRVPRTTTPPSHDGRNNSGDEEDEDLLSYSTPIAKRKHHQHRSEFETMTNNGRSSSMEHYSDSNNSNNNKPRHPAVHPSSMKMDEIPSTILATAASEPMGLAVTGLIVGAEAEYSQQQTGTTMLTVFFNYIGMLCVGLVYAMQTWYSNRSQSRQDRTHVEYNVLTTDLNEMSEIHDHDDNQGIKDHIELVGRKMTNGSNAEVADIVEVHDDEQDDFEEDEEKQHLHKQKDHSSASIKVTNNSKSWIRLHWPVFQVAVMDVIANALVTVGFFYVGSGMYQVIYSSIVIWCAILTRIFLGRKLNGIQWLAIFGVTLGLAISAVGTVQDESPDGPVQSWLEKSFGALVTLGATFLYACVYVLSDKVLSTFDPKPIPEKVCSMVGGYASLLTLVYLCIHTFPNWQTEVVDVVEARHGSKIGIFMVYPLVTISSMLHSLNYYVLLSRINNIAVGIMQSLRAVLVFVMSHYLFCGISSTQCFNEWKFVSAIVVIGCVTLFSFNSPAKAVTSVKVTSGSKS